jgi:glycogen(starch) synthase
MRPLWITENYPPDRGGMAQSCDRIVRALRKRGVTIDVAHVSRRYSEWRVEAKEGGTHFACPADEDPAHTLNRLWTAVSRNSKNTHIVAFGGTLPLLAGPAYASWLRMPLITLMRGNDFDAAIFSPKKSDILRHALASSSVVCTVTRDHAARIAALVPGIEPRWIPNGVDASTWELMPHDREEAKRHRVDGRRTLGIFGQLKQKKGVQFFLETLEKSGCASRFHLLLVGDLEPSMVAWLDARRETISSQVLPFRDRFELLPLFAACDAVVVPSFYDGLPNVVLEAAALGVPLLASNAGGMADLLNDGSNAIVFDAGDEHDCRRAIFDAARITDDDLHARGTRCRDLVLEHFSVAREAERYIEVFKHANEKRSAPAAANSLS